MTDTRTTRTATLASLRAMTPEDRWAILRRLMAYLITIERRGDSVTATEILDYIEGIRKERAS